MTKLEFLYPKAAKVKIKGRKGEFIIEHPVMLRMPTIENDGSFSLVDMAAYRLTDGSYAWETKTTKLNKQR
jgi:hypothetical protein